MTTSSVLTRDWVQAYVDEWNDDASFVETLAEAGFSARVAYGMSDEAGPRAVLKVHNGRVVQAEPMSEKPTDWDLRADNDQWRRWLQEPPGLFALGIAFTSRGLQFRSGDYSSMIKNPPIAGSFVHSFVLMSRAFQRVNIDCPSFGDTPA